MKSIDIRNEIEFEKQMLANYKGILSRAKTGCLIFQENSGSGSFLYCRNWKAKRKYLKKDDPRIEELYLRRFSRTAVNVLNDNIRLLTEIEKNFKEFDLDTINALLPKAYRKARELLISQVPETGEETDFRGGQVMLIRSGWRRRLYPFC